MRTLSLYLLALCLLAPAAAWADTHESSRMEWRSGGLQLELFSEQGVVRVRSASPAGHFSLREGDRVLAVDGRPVHAIDTVTQTLAGSSRPTLPVTVQRGGRETTLQVDTAAWRPLAPPAAPAPPPAPPAPRR